MSFLKKRGGRWYLYEKVRVPSDDPKKPKWKQTARALSSDYETANEYQINHDYNNNRRRLGLPNNRFLWTDFIERLKAEVFPGKKIRSWKRDLVALDAFARLMKPVRIADVTADTVSAFKVRRLNDGVAKGTVNVDMGALSAAMTKAVEWGYLREHPCRFVESYPVPQRSRRALTREETARAIAAARKSESPDALGMLMFFLLTGVRLEEMTHLLWERVDLKKKTFKVEAWKSDEVKDWPAGWRRVSWSPKTCQIRENPLDAQLMALLRARARERDTPLVFPGRMGPRQPYRLGELFGRVYKRGKVEGATIHTLRHTYATRMVESKCDLPTLSRLLGHSGPQVTMIYFTAEMGHKRKQQGKLRLT